MTFNGLVGQLCIPISNLYFLSRIDHILFSLLLINLLMLYGLMGAHNYVFIICFELFSN
jgi:hypothetical protein